MPSAPAGRAARLLRAAALVVAASPLALAAPALAQDGPATTVVGQLVQAYPESARENAPMAAAPLSWVQEASGRAVRVATADVGGIPPGSTVRVTVGDAVRDAGTGDGYGRARAVTAADVLAVPQGTTDDGAASDTEATTGPDAPSTGGDATGGGGDDTVDLSGAAADLTDRVAVVLVVPESGAPDGTSLQGLVDAVDGPVHDFWAGQTGDAIRLGVTSAHGWVTTAAGCDQPTALWQQAAAAAGFTPGPGRHLLVYISGRADDAGACSYGLAQVGAGRTSGGSLYVRDTLPSLIAHEIGHNFGLGHSSERQCDAAVDSGSCRTVAYGDYYDVMGASWEELGTLNAPQEARLGVLPAAQRRTVAPTDPGGSVTLAPISARTGVRALRLTAAGADYWLEYRAPSGQDSWLGTDADWLGLRPGVLLHRSAGLPDTALLLDGTPSPEAGWETDSDTTLPTGVPVRLPDGFTVTVEAESAAGARISVATAGPASVPAPAAAPSSAPAILPGGTCPDGCAAGPAATSGPTAGTQPLDRPTPPATAHRDTTKRDVPQRAAAGGNVRDVAQATRLSPAALRSPTALVTVAVLACGALLLGWVVVGRLRRGRSR
jgi:hypothetical protein